MPGNPKIAGATNFISRPDARRAKTAAPIERSKRLPERAVAVQLAAAQVLEEAGSFSGVGRHVHDPDVAVVFSPREIEETTVGGKIDTDVTSPALELRESRNFAGT